MKKKVVTTGVLSSILALSLYTPNYALAEKVERSQIQTEQDIEEILSQNNIELGTTVFIQDGLEVTVTTELGSFEDFVEREEQKNHKVINNVLPKKSEIMPLALQNDTIAGSGKVSANGIVGYVETKELKMGLNAIGGSVVGNISAWSNTSGVTSKPRLEVNTYGLVGGTIGLMKTYVLGPTKYSSGTSNHYVNQSLTGVIASYSVTLYGDHEKGANSATSKASLSKK